MLKGSIPQNAHNGEYLKKVFAAADEELKKPDLALPYSKFRLFADTGNRLVYETDYIAHRKRLGLFAIMSLADGGEQWVRAAADTIWAILDEFTWALPAHLSGTPWEKKPYVVDLFAAETAFALSEVDALLGSRLPEPVRARMRRLIEERVINPFFAGEIHFHQSNWAAVQISGVIAPLCYFGWEEKLQAALPGIRAAYDQYFASFREDACCLEGALYWMFGFGYFCYGAEILRDATHGAVDYLAEARVQEIAKFPSRIALGKNAVIPFADGPHHLNYHIGLMDFLHSTFGVPQIPQENEMAYGQDDRYRLPDILRDLYWYDDAPRKAAAPEPRVDFPVSQWFVRRGALTLVVKGGTNREPHNHNDLGSVVLYDGDRFIVDDLGWSDYDKQYFSSER